jgi:hypothetical protein
MKILSFISASFLLLMIGGGVRAYATAEVPSAAVWVTPSDAKAGDAIMLNAFVYNNTTDEASATVVFTQGIPAEAKGIATATITVPANTAKIATVSWTMPEKSALVTATVTKAVTKAKKDIPSLAGVLGTVTIGGTTMALPDFGNVKGRIGVWLAAIEVFRLKQAEHYAQVLKESKQTVNGVAKKDIVNLLTPDDSNAPTPTTEGQLSAGSVKETESHAGAYASMVFATAANSFFAHKALFYISLIIVGLFIVRFIVGRFV